MDRFIYLVRTCSLIKFIQLRILGDRSFLTRYNNSSGNEKYSCEIFMFLRIIFNFFLSFPDKFRDENVYRTLMQIRTIGNESGYSNSSKRSGSFFFWIFLFFAVCMCFIAIIIFHRYCIHFSESDKKNVNLYIFFTGKVAMRYFRRWEILRFFEYFRFLYRKYKYNKIFYNLYWKL